ncbi:MAG: hypothetical protein K1X78_17120 [Verrucomicrobiaceae bacterium]|nr:hypothetical protein [Verrucomicrobiaceae bacterium]
MKCDGPGDDNALTTWVNNHGGAVATAPSGPLTWTDNYNPASFVSTRRTGTAPKVM